MLAIDIISYVATYVDIDTLRNLLKVNFETTTTTTTKIATTKTERTTVDNDNSVTDSMTTSSSSIIKKMYMEENGNKNIMSLSDLYDRKLPKKNVSCEEERKFEFAYDGTLLLSGWGYEVKNNNKRLIYKVTYNSNYDGGNNTNNFIDDIMVYGVIFNQYVEYDHNNNQITIYEATNKLDMAQYKLHFSYDDLSALNNNDENHSTDNDKNLQVVKSIEIKGNFFKSSSILFVNSYKEEDDKDDGNSNIKSSSSSSDNDMVRIPIKIRDFRSIRLLNDLSIYGTGINKEILNELKHNPSLCNVKELFISYDIDVSYDDLVETFMEHELSLLSISRRSNKNNNLLLFGQKYQEIYKDCSVRM